MRTTEIELPDLSELGKTVLKREIDRHSNCFICEFKYDCSLETKAQKKCIPHKHALAIKKAIDFTIDSIRENQRKEK